MKSPWSIKKLATPRAGGVARAQGITSGDGLFTVSAASLSFGDQKLNLRSPAQNIYVTPTNANTALTFSISIAGEAAGDSVYATYCDYVDYCQVFVTFGPSVVGSRTASLVISDGTQSVNIPLTR